MIVITVLAHTATGADAFPQKTRKKLILMPHDISVQVCKFEILIPLQVALQSGRYISNGDFQSKRAKNGVPNFLVQLCSLLTLGSLTKHGEGNGQKGAQLIKLYKLLVNGMKQYDVIWNDKLMTIIKKQ